MITYAGGFAGMRLTTASLNFNRKSMTRHMKKLHLSIRTEMYDYPIPFWVKRNWKCGELGHIVMIYMKGNTRKSALIHADARFDMAPEEYGIRFL